MRSLTAPLDELSTAHAVVLEAPSIVTHKFEHDMLNFTQKILSQCPALAIIVQPSLRRKSNKSLWVHRWNRLHNAPFKFRQTCSCQTGNAVPGCHLTCMIGSTRDLQLSPCAEIPTYCATSASSQLSLGATLHVISASLLDRGVSGGIALTSAQVAPPTCTFRDPHAAGGSSGELPHGEGSVLAGMLGDRSSLACAQRTPDLALCPDLALDASIDLALCPLGEEHLALNPDPVTADAYPTDAKEREKARRKQQKESGNEHVVKKRRKIMEDHHDDCGEDLSSITDLATCALCYPCEPGIDDTLSDEDRDECLRLQFGALVQSYPVDISQVARAKLGEPLPGPDRRAVPPRQSTCPGCKCSRSIDDWAHTREIGQCQYPHHEPWIPECIACQDRKPRYDTRHTYEFNKCKWAAPNERASLPRQRRKNSNRPHEPVAKPDNDPTARLPGNVAGRELGADGEEQIAQEDRQAAVDPPNSGGAASSGSGGAAGASSGQGGGDSDRRGMAPRKDAAAPTVTRGLPRRRERSSIQLPLRALVEFVRVVGRQKGWFAVLTWTAIYRAVRALSSQWALWGLFGRGWD